jgi:hypothetical protein
MASRNALLWLTRGAAGGWAFNDGMMAAGRPVDRRGTMGHQRSAARPQSGGFYWPVCVPRPIERPWLLRAAACHVSGASSAVHACTRPPARSTPPSTSQVSLTVTTHHRPQAQQPSMHFLLMLRDYDRVN